VHCSGENPRFEIGRVRADSELRCFALMVGAARTKQKSVGLLLDTLQHQLCFLWLIVRWLYRSTFPEFDSHFTVATRCGNQETRKMQRNRERSNIIYFLPSGTNGMRDTQNRKLFLCFGLINSPVVTSRAASEEDGYKRTSLRYLDVSTCNREKLLGLLFTVSSCSLPSFAVMT